MSDGPSYHPLFVQQLIPKTSRSQVAPSVAQMAAVDFISFALSAEIFLALASSSFAALAADF